MDNKLNKKLWPGDPCDDLEASLLNNPPLYYPTLGEHCFYVQKAKVGMAKVGMAVALIFDEMVVWYIILCFVLFC